MKHLRIVSAQSGGSSLEDYAEEVHASLSSALRVVDQVATVPASRLPGQPVTEMDIRTIMKLRRNRDRFFEGEIFADPAWDMLLELYAARLGQRRISVGSVCLAAAVPATTALRWISLLQSKGLIERSADPMDGRRFHLSLSDAGLDAMASYFGTVSVGATLI